MADTNMEDYDPSDHEVDGQSFFNAALTGSGTLNPDGTLGPPLPDPTAVRGLDGRKTSGGREIPDPLIVVDGNLVPTSTLGQDLGEDQSDTPTKAAPAKKTTGTTTK